MVKILCIFLVLLIWLCACSSDNTSTTPVASSESSSAESTDPLNMIPNTLQVSNDGLLIVQGTSLHYYSFQTQAITGIADNIDIETLYAAPEINMVLYSPLETREIRYVNLQNLDQRTLIEETDTGSNHWAVIERSLDDEWLVLQVSGELILISADAEEIYTALEWSSVALTWLSDNSLLMLGANRGQPTYDVFSMSLKETVSLDIEPEALREDQSIMDRELSTLDVSFPEQSFQQERLYIHYPDALNNQADMMPCGLWEIRGSFDDSRNTDTLYAEYDVYEFADVHLMPDQSILFLQSKIQNCSIELPVVEILWVTNGQTRVLARNVFPGNTLGRNYDEIHQNNNTGRLTVSPDGNFVAWVSGDLDAGYSSVSFMDLNNSEYPLFTLLETTIDRNNLNKFIDEQIYYKVYWVSR